MKTILQILAVGVFCALNLNSSAGWSRAEYDSQQLLMKNGDEINNLVRKKIKLAQQIQAKASSSEDGSIAEPEAIEALKDAMRIVLARPDQDGTRSNAYSRLERELGDMNALNTVLEELTDEGIEAIKSGRDDDRRVTTYSVMLEGLMTEIKPDIATNAKLRTLVEKIKAANLKISDKVKARQRAKAMRAPESPSELAAKILDEKKKK